MRMKLWYFDDTGARRKSLCFEVTVMSELKAGLRGTAAWTVTEDMSARVCRSGSLDVFATPMLVALMECAACDAVKDALPEGSTSVGTEMDVKHTAASPVGAEVSAEAVLTAVDGRKLTFEITACEGVKIIGTAKHERFIVDAARFMGKLAK